MSGSQAKKAWPTWFDILFTTTNTLCWDVWNRELHQVRGQHVEPYRMSSYFKRGVLDPIDTRHPGCQLHHGQWESAGREAARPHALSYINEWAMTCNLIQDLHYGTFDNLDHGCAVQELKTVYYNRGNRTAHQDLGGVTYNTEVSNDGLEALFQIKDEYAQGWVPYREDN